MVVIKKWMFTYSVSLVEHIITQSFWHIFSCFSRITENYPRQRKGGRFLFQGFFLILDTNLVLTSYNTKNIEAYNKVVGNRITSVDYAIKMLSGLLLASFWPINRLPLCVLSWIVRFMAIVCCDCRSQMYSCNYENSYFINKTLS